MSMLAAIVRKSPRRLAAFVRSWMPVQVACESLELDALQAVDNGRYDVAEELLLKAVAVAQSASAARGSRGARGSGALARMRFRLAGLYFLLREVDKSEQQVLLALPALQLPLSPHAHLLPDAYELLAEVQFEKGDFRQAEETIRQALHVASQRFSDKPGELAHQEWVFARLLFRQSRYDASVPLYHSALRAYLSIEGPESTSVAQLVLELGNAQRKSGNCGAAIETLERALVTQETISGTRALAVTPYLSLLGAAYADCGYGPLAVECYVRTLEIYEDTMPPGHPRVGYVLFQLADSLNNLRRFHDAERMARRAVEILRHAEDAGLSEATQVLAAIKADRGQDEEADRLFSSALLMLERRVGGTHLEVADYLDRHAAVVWKLGRHEEAEEMMTRAREIRRTVAVVG